MNPPKNPHDTDRWYHDFQSPDLGEVHHRATLAIQKLRCEIDGIGIQDTHQIPITRPVFLASMQNMLEHIANEIDVLRLDHYVTRRTILWAFWGGQISCLITVAMIVLTSTGTAKTVLSVLLVACCLIGSIALLAIFWHVYHQKAETPEE